MFVCDETHFSGINLHTHSHVYMYIIKMHTHTHMCAHTSVHTYGTLYSECSYNWCGCSPWPRDSWSILLHLQNWNKPHLAEHKPWQQWHFSEQPTTCCSWPQCSGYHLSAGPSHTLGRCWTGPLSWWWGGYWDKWHHQALLTLWSMSPWFQHNYIHVLFLKLHPKAL